MLAGLAWSLQPARPTGKRWLLQQNNDEDGHKCKDTVTASTKAGSSTASKHIQCSWVLMQNAWPSATVATSLRTPLESAMRLGLLLRQQTHFPAPWLPMPRVTVPPLQIKPLLSLRPQIMRPSPPPRPIRPRLRSVWCAAYTCACDWEHGRR